MHKLKEMTHNMKILKFISIAYCLTVLIILQSCKIFDASKNEIIVEEFDFTRIHKAVLFVKPGNATTDNSIHLSIIDSKDKLKDSQTGNVFVADSDYGKATIDSQSVTLKWKSNDTLIVSYDSRLRFFNQQTSKKELVVIYEKK